MSTDYVKRYYNKVISRIETVNSHDPFSLSFTNAIAAGEQTLFQKYLTETRIFDGTWVDFIEANLMYLDSIVREPRSFIKDQRSIVPIERAKKTTAESVRHLAANSRYVKMIKDNGEIIPKKILTIFKEEELAIYENRFVRTLIDKLVSFVERRYETIKQLIGTDYINKFHFSSNFDYESLKVECNLNLNVIKKVHDSDAEIRNHQLLERIESLRAYIIGFANSEFMRILKSSKPVYPPIQKTNIILREPNYRKCYELWLFIDSYSKLDYTIETGVSEQRFNDSYLHDLRQLVLMSFSTIIANDESNIGQYDILPVTIRKEKKIKIINDNDDLTSTTEKVDLERNLINEYYYQESRKLHSRRINEKVNDGEPYHVALKDVYQSTFKITDDIFDSLMEIPENIQKDQIALLRFNKRNLQAIDEIIKFKLEDIKRMEKNRAKLEKDIEKAKLEIEEQRREAQKREADRLEEQKREAQKKEAERIKAEKMQKREALKNEVDSSTEVITKDEVQTPQLPQEEAPKKRKYTINKTIKLNHPKEEVKEEPTEVKKTTRKKTTSTKKTTSKSTTGTKKTTSKKTTEGTTTRTKQTTDTTPKKTSTKKSPTKKTKAQLEKDKLKAIREKEKEKAKLLIEKEKEKLKANRNKTTRKPKAKTTEVAPENFVIKEQHLDYNVVDETDNK